MFRSQFSDHHQGSITVLVQLLLIRVRASSYSSMWLYVVCASIHTVGVSVRVVSDYVLYIIHNQTPRRQVHRMYRRTDNIQPHTGIRRCTHAYK
jgi:hypothetical protein